MKTIFNLVSARTLLFATILFLSSESNSQPDYTFRNPSRISGTHLRENAKYRFSRVKPGVDVILTIIEIRDIELNDLDGGDGYTEAFQPVIQVPRKTEGYVEFKMDFVTEGGTSLRVQPEVPLTAIDIDGYIYPDEKIYEFDEFKESPTYRIDYDFIGTNLDVKLRSSWVRTINKTAVDYPGIDTIKKDVMFSMIYAGVSSVTFRVGANNKSRTDMERLRSVYFKKFNYGNKAVLAQSHLKLFNGRKEKTGVLLNWEFSGTAGMKEYSLERSVNGKDYQAITSTIVNENSAYVNSYNDATAGKNTNSYRLKVVSADGRTAYSQIIVFRGDATEAPGKLGVFPTLIQNGTASVQVNSGIAVKTAIQVMDYAGRVIYNSQVQLARGANSFSLDLSGKAASGNYIVAMQVEGNVLTQKIIIR